MAQSKWICKNVDVCDKAFNNDGKAFDDLMGHDVEAQLQPYKCEDCGSYLEEVKKQGNKIDVKKIAIIAVLLVILGGVGFVAYKFISGDWPGEKPTITITIEPANPTVTVNETIRLTTKTDPEDAKLTLTWASEDESIATVSRNGVVKGVTTGNVTITVKDEKKKVSESVTVNVLPDVQVVQTIKLIPESLSLRVKASGKLTTEITPENADQSSLRWESSNPSVATVDAGNINAVAEGVAMITLTDTKGGVKAEAKITVTTGVTQPPCGTYKGETSSNGQPHGLGTFTYRVRTLIDDLKMVYAEQGDYITGNFREGKIVSVQLYSSGGNLKQTVIPQQPTSICR